MMMENVYLLLLLLLCILTFLYIIIAYEVSLVKFKSKNYAKEVNAPIILSLLLTSEELRPPLLGISLVTLL